MAGEVNAVDSVKVNTSNTTSQPQRVVEQEEEQMFDFSSALETGYEIGKTALKFASGYGALEMINEGAKDSKGNLHKTAENIRQFKEEHPVLFWFAGGLVGQAIIWADEQANK